MRVNKTKLMKYSLVCEGKFEYQLISYFKNEILNATNVPYCRKHSKCCGGTINQRDIEGRCNNNCCYQFIVFDEDEQKKENIDNIKRICNLSNKCAIISIPSAEIILLAIFDVFEAKISVNKLDKKLKDYFKKEGLKYEHSNFEYLSKIIEWVTKNENKKVQWLEGIKKLNEIKKSNFIDIINFFKEVQNGKI